MTALAELQAECDVHGIRLFPTGDGGLTIDGPQDALTPALIGRLKANKNELLAMLPLKGDTHTPPRKPSIDVRPEEQSPAGNYDWITEAFATPPKSAEPRCRCHEEQRWWRSIFGDHLICGICHPPAVPEVVKEWYKNEEIIVAN